MKNTAFLLLLMASISMVNAQTDIKYPVVSAQVSFKSVTELPVKQYDRKVTYGDDPLQYGLLWLPPEKSKQPFIVMIHGGCWLNAFNVNHTFAMATALAQRGFPVWSLEYRRTGDAGGGWPGSFQDIQLALSKVELLHEHQVNTDEIILIGHSAGGHLALLAASELTDIKLKKTIGLAAITDISRYALGTNSCQQATPQFMGGMPHEVPTAYQQASLIYRQLPESTILMQGDHDEIVPVLQAQLADTKTVMVDAAGHFDWIHPGTPAFKALLNQITGSNDNLSQ